MDASTSQVDVQKLICLGNELISVLSKSKDTDVLMQSLGLAQSLRNFYDGESHDVHKSLEEYTRRISDCKQKIADAERKTIDNAELELLRSELEEEMKQEASLRQEIRKLYGEMDDLEGQRISLEERNEALKRKEKELLKSQKTLSMCASVTKVIPDLEDRSKTRGYIVDWEKKKSEKFEYTAPPFSAPIEICNDLWNKIRP